MGTRAKIVTHVGLRMGTGILSNYGYGDEAIVPYHLGVGKKI
jgi:hypothetical protein